MTGMMTGSCIQPTRFFAANRSTRWFPSGSASAWVRKDLQAPVDVEEAEGHLLGFAQSNFLFHVSTSYHNLRHNGVELGKRDDLGSFMRGPWSRPGSCDQPPGGVRAPQLHEAVVHAPLVIVMRWVLGLAMLLTALGHVRGAHACQPPPFCEATRIYAGSSAPANVPVIRIDLGRGQIDWGDRDVEVPPSAEEAIRIRHADGTLVAIAVEYDRGLYTVRFEETLQAGEQLTWDVWEPRCQSWWFGSSLQGARLQITEAAPIPTTQRLELSLSDQVVEPLEVPVGCGSCTLDVVAAQRSVRVTETEALRPWRGLIQYEVEVDGRRTWTRGKVSQGLNVLCEAEVRNCPVGGRPDAARADRVRMGAWLPGTEWRAESSFIDAYVDCAGDPGPVDGADMGSEAQDMGSVDGGVVPDLGIDAGEPSGNGASLRAGDEGCRCSAAKRGAVQWTLAIGLIFAIVPFVRPADRARSRRAA